MIILQIKYDEAAILGTELSQSLIELFRTISILRIFGPGAY